MFSLLTVIEKSILGLGYIAFICGDVFKYDMKIQPMAQNSHLGSGYINRYPLISKVILIQVAISLAGLLVITSVGLSFLKSMELTKIEQEKSAISQVIEPNLDQYESWYLLQMPILAKTFDKLKKEYALASARVITKAQANKLANEPEILLVPNPQSEFGSKSDYFVEAELSSARYGLSGLPLYWYAILITVLVMSVVVVYWFNRSVRHQLFTAMTCIDKAIEDITRGQHPDFSYSEQNEFTRFLNSMSILHKSTAEIERSKVILDITKQVAHDIRSPLSALNVAVSSFKEVSEEKRLLLKSAVQRINDIANDLLKKGNVGRPTTDGLGVQFIPPLIESLVSEKKMEYKGLRGVSINFEFEGGMNLFGLVEQNGLKRILSNLINNAVEALPNDSGIVRVALDARKGLSIVISDNGIGMPSDVVEMLGKHRASVGKLKMSNSGSGLGVYSAVQMLKQWGGALKISSAVGAGSTFEIQLPSATPPAWWADQLDLSNMRTVVCLGDDLSTHEFWKSRLSKSGLDCVCIQSGIDFENYVNAMEASTLRSCYFLIDYRIGTEPKSGLQLIEELKIADRSILVSNSNDDAVAAKLEELNLKLLAKFSIGAIPIIPSHYEAELNG